MFKLPQRDTKTLLAIHGWSGILLGLLLYAVICTGVAAVFAEEINDWSAPLAHRHEATVLPSGIDATVRRLATQVDPQFLEEVAIFQGAGGRLNLRYHRHETKPDGTPGERGVEYEVDPATWGTLATRSGWEDQLAAQNRANGVAAFLIDLHVRLHIPEPYGLFVTGVLGLAMMVAAVTGLIVHRHLIADLFTLRVNHDALLRRRDLHVIAGSWNLPFAIILAFTGSFFSFASSVGLPAMAMVKFGGDQAALSDTLYGAARAEDRRAAPMANLETMLADARQRHQAEPYYISIEHYGRADATVSIITELPGNNLVYSTFLYDGATGKFLNEKPPLGTIASAGSSLVGLMYPLHFGNFAGSLSKAVWVALGFAAAYVTLTGMLLWTRRREEQLAWQRMARVVHYAGYGLPLALVGAPYAYFALRSSEMLASTLQDIAFLAVSALAAGVAWGVRDLEHVRRWLLGATGVALLGLPLMRIACGGLGWGAAWRTGVSAVPAVDIALIISGLACLWAISRARRRASSASKLSVPAPA